MTRPRKFAEDSSVPVDRSRAEIAKLLTGWGCSALGWTDHFAAGDIELGFVWDPAIAGRIGKPARSCPGRAHGYRLTCAVCNWKDGYPAGDGGLYRVKMRLAVGTDPQKQRTAHRLLLLKVKADLNAAMAGLVRAEEVFLPYIVDREGNTVADVVLPRLQAYAAALPPAGGTGGAS